MTASVRYETRAELDVPGETARQARVGVIWAVCLLAAMIVAASGRSAAKPSRASVTDNTRWEGPSTASRILPALGLGFFLPGLLTFFVTHRRRRGGGHARGIRIEVTDEGELRVWGRPGYGHRTQLKGASLSERLVDVYAGRLGAWRQRRLTVTPAKGRSMELATIANEQDMNGPLKVYGGEGDCLEMKREDYFALLEEANNFTQPNPGEEG